MKPRFTSHRPPLVLLGSLACALGTSCALNHQGLAPDGGGPDHIDVVVNDADGFVPPDVPGDMADVPTCTADLNHDPMNCGVCGHVCPGAANADATCVAGMCATTCQANFGDCDHDPGNGCEATLMMSPNCGACGTTCTSLEVCSPPAAGDAGAAYSCQSTCTGMNCSGMCIDTMTDTANCGACGHACASGPSSHATCASGACGIACDPGTTDCDHNAANGCERNTATDVANCGACGNACATHAHATATCAGGACGFMCMTGFGDCSTTMDGCETNTNTDPMNCGACAHACPRPMNANPPTCMGGTCGFSCMTGYVQVGGMCSPCGNHTLDTGETCDDGNNTSGDGCSATCQNELVSGATCPTQTVLLNAGVQSYAGNTTGPGLVNTFSCGGGPGSSANEITYFARYVGAGTNVTVTVTPTFNAVVDRRSDCTGAAGTSMLCQAPVNAGTTYTHDFTVPAGRTEIWVIDGYMGAMGSYTISFNLH